MKSKSARNYSFQSRNVHFKNILEKSYYVELGVIDMRVMNRFLKGEKIQLKDMVDLNILSNGVGSITGDDENDLYYQLNYLINLRLKNSTFKFILTAGALKYYDEDGCEKYAPLVLIPFDFDYQHLEIKKSASPYFNPILLKYLAKYLQKNSEIKKRLDNNIPLDDKEVENDKEKQNKLEDIQSKLEEEKKRFIDEFSNRKLNTIAEIDKLGLDIIKVTKTSIDPSNFFTIAFVEYPDIILNNYSTSIERSINELNEKQLALRYFKEIKGILPTNDDQKYVCLKVNEGERFSVDGRLGSGKTYTIINIIADQIAKGKKILYVNQDLDNIFDLEKNMSYLGLSDYIYNMTQNIRDINKVSLEFDELEKKQEVTIQSFEKMYDLLLDYQGRIHGFPISEIIEKLAILKKENPSITCLPLETVLERHEVKYLYSQLQSIEESLQLIDLYANNIWHRLNTSYNNIAEEDIINRTIELQNSNNQLYNELKKYAQKYNLNVPKSVNDFLKLTTHIYHFASIRPLPSWKDEKIRAEALKHIREIQSCYDINQSLMSYYNENIHKDYRYGNMQDILRELAASHIQVENNLETNDQLYINRLLDFTDNIHLFSKEIEQSIKKINEEIEKLQNIFLIKEITDDVCTFFGELNTFLNENKFNQVIVHTYLEQAGLFSKNGEIIDDAYHKYLEEESFLPQYVNKFELLTMNLLDTIFNKNNAKNVLARYVNKKVSRQNHKDVKEIVEGLKIYYDSMNTMQAGLKELFGNNEYDREFIDQFHIFYNYVNHLSIKHLNAFKIFLQKYQENQYHNKYVEQVSRVLSSFKEEEYKISSYCVRLKNYNVHIQANSIVERINELKKWNLYLRRVHQLKEEIRHIFIKEKPVEYTDIKELIEKDNRYIKLHQKLEANAPTYESSIGKYYYGLKTAISDITQTIENYGDFLNCVNKNCIVDDLFTDKVFREFLEDTKYVDEIYGEWNAHYRAFNVCFKAGQPEIQYNPFEFNIKLFRQFVEKKSQVAPILNINHITDELLNYGLKDLHDGIRSCKYGNGVSNQFLYSVLMGHYHKIEKEKAELLNPTPIKEMLENYLEYEYQYCLKNREELIKNIDETKKYDVILVDKFNDRNEVVNSLITTTPVFLADLDILNSNLDLAPFDLVIIDDAHLSSANKYRRIVEAKQTVVFGDVLFQTSVSNALMKRLGEACMVRYRRRYVQMNSRFHNQWSYNNQYIYSYDNRSTIVQLDQFSDFVEEIFKRYHKFTSHIINILVGSEETRRLVYTAIVSRLAREYSVSEITIILSHNIRILNALTEGNRYVNDVFIYFDDIKDLEPSVQELIFKNFITVHNSVVIYYVKHRMESMNTKTVKLINHFIGKNMLQEKNSSGITKILIDTLLEKGVNIDTGIGMFDFIIKNKKPIGVMVVGKMLDQFGDLFDDFLFYKNEYEKRGWEVYPIYVLDLLKDFDGCTKKLIELSKMGK